VIAVFELEVGSYRLLLVFLLLEGEGEGEELADEDVHIEL
jgi:hypothetical protein